MGIDVAKDRLDVVLRPTGEYLELQNSDTDIRKLIGRLGARLPANKGTEKPSVPIIKLCTSMGMAANPIR